MKHSIIVALTLVCTLPLGCGGSNDQTPDPSGTVRAGARQGASGTAADDKGAGEVGDDKGADADEHADGGKDHGVDDVTPETEPAEHEDGGHHQGGGGDDTGEAPGDHGGHGGPGGSGNHG